MSQIQMSVIKDARFWDTLGERLLAPLLFAAAGTGRHISDVVAWVDARQPVGLGPQVAAHAGEVVHDHHAGPPARAPQRPSRCREDVVSARADDAEMQGHPASFFTAGTASIGSRQAQDRRGDGTSRAGT